MDLSSIQTADGMYVVLDTTKHQYFADALELLSPGDQQQQVFTKTLRSLLSQTAPHASGILLEPTVTQGLLKTSASLPSLLLSVEQVSPGDVDPLAVPHINADWGADAIANNYAVAHMELCYHPAEQEALRKKQLVAEVADYCHHLGIDFVLKLVMYTPADQEFEVTTFQEEQLQAAQEFRAWVDMFVLQYPQDPLVAATLTTELDQPWLLHSHGYEYQSFKETLRMALESGAQGCVVGEVLWEGVPPIADDVSVDVVAETTRYFETISRDRMIEISRIVNEFSSEDVTEASK